jgi:hypothetical protein
MDADALQEALEEAGLTGYQADAYITLLAQGMAPAVEIANQSTVPVSQIYEVLRTLEQRGYIETFEQDTLHARPKEPVTVLRDLRSRGRLMDDAADGDERYSVGGWGAVFEEIEAVRIDLEAISFASVFDGTTGTETEFSADTASDGSDAL